MAITTGLGARRAKGRPPYLGHYDALEELLGREGWPAEEWLRGFAAESYRIGEALGSFKEDVSAEMADHKARLDQGFPSLSKLHSVLMCQASAKTLAESMRPSDLNQTPQPGEEGRREALSRALNRSFNEINTSEMPAWAASLSQGLAQKLQGALGSVEIARGVARLVSETDNFTMEGRSMLIAGLTGTAPDMGDGAQSVARATAGESYIPSTSGQNSTLLDLNHEPNDVAYDILLHAMTRFEQDPSAQLESRFYALRPAYAYDHSELTKRYPQGLYDGSIMLFPIAAVAAGMGGPLVFQHAAKVLSRAAREALGVEDESGQGPERVEPGALLEILASHGLMSAAKSVLKTPLEASRVAQRVHPADVANALDEATLAGLGLPRVPARVVAARKRLDDGLREAVWLGLDETATTLLAEGADPRSVSAYGVSALMLAAVSGNAAWVERLAPESELEGVDFQGKSAQDYAHAAGGSGKAAKWLEAFSLSMFERSAMTEALGGPAGDARGARASSRL